LEFGERDTCRMSFVFCLLSSVFCLLSWLLVLGSWFLALDSWFLLPDLMLSKEKNFNSGVANRMLFIVNLLLLNIARFKSYE